MRRASPICRNGYPLRVVIRRAEGGRAATARSRGAYCAAVGVTTVVIGVGVVMIVLVPVPWIAAFKA